MKTTLRLAGVLALPLIITLIALAHFEAKQAFAQAPRVLGPFVGTPVRVASFDGDVRALPAASATANEATLPRIRPRIETNAAILAAPDPTWQPARATIAMPTTTINFGGISQTTFITRNNWPPDPNGDVGRDHYVQAVNHSIGIYSKTGTVLAAFAYATMFTGTGTFCDTNPRDDPVVWYDQLADRWLFTFFAFRNPSTEPFYQCFAVAKTSDPVSGGWWLYAMLAHPSYLDDYPKFGMWPDAYYMTANMDQLGCCFKGVRVWALDRTAMLNGTFSATVNSVYFDLPWDGTCCYSLLPSHWRGAAPPIGAPNFMVDAEAVSPGSALHLWKFHVDWANPLSSTFTGPLTLTVASYVDVEGFIVPQLGSTEQVDIGDLKLMAPLAYRRVGNVEALWASQMISGSNGATAIRWYEIRDPNGTPTLHQQGTFQPDANFRWMPSLAVDGNGNMAVGYSVSSAGMFPAIRYAGRLASDPLGLLQGEASLIEGTGSQLGGYNRWGDYSAMSVDPVDGCTFWYTNMVYETTGSNWQTRIGAFKFPSCGIPTAIALVNAEAHSESDLPLLTVMAAIGVVACAVIGWRIARAVRYDGCG